MLVECLIVVILSAVIYLYEEKHGKSGHRISSMVLFIWIYILLSGNYENADTYNYEVEYNENLTGFGFSVTGFWGYYFLNKLCQALSMSYYQSRFVAYVIGFLALIMAIDKMKINRYMTLVLYMLFPMLIDGTQTKNFIAMSLLTLAMTFLISGKKSDKIIFMVLIILAGGFHPIFYVYFPLVICDSKKVQTRFVLPIVLFSLIFANRGMSSLLADFILAHLDEFLAERASKFFMSRVGGYWVKFLATGTIITLVYIMRRAVLLNPDSKDEEKRFSNIVMYCALFSLTFLPFYFWRSDFARLLRSFFPVFHMLFIMFLNVKNIPPIKQGKKSYMLELATSKPMIIMMYLMLLGYMFYWDIYLFKDIVIIPLFTYNSFFDVLNASFR